LFAFLEVCCLFLVIRHNSPQGEIAQNSWLLYGGIVMEKAESARNFLRLREMNEQLRAANAELLSRLPNAFYTESVQIDSIQNDSLRQRYTYTSAEVINKTPLSGNITYVLNRGNIHGVELHQGVVSDGGIVGIVIGVSPRHCRVMSLMHRDMRLSAGLRNTNFFGSLRWEGGDTRFASLYNIPEYARLAVGDTVETTGYSNIFPTAIPIGIVENFEQIESETMMNIKVRLFNDFFTLDHAYIVRDLMKGDLDQLDNPSE
jgi:rod shape-determining protein MreC